MKNKLTDLKGVDTLKRFGEFKGEVLNKQDDDNKKKYSKSFLKKLAEMIRKA